MPLDSLYNILKKLEQKMIEMYQDGPSFNQISKAINDGRTGGSYNAEIKNTLSKFGVK